MDSRDPLAEAPDDVDGRRQEVVELLDLGSLVGDETVLGLELFGGRLGILLKQLISEYSKSKDKVGLLESSLSYLAPRPPTCQCARARAP